MHQLGNCLIPRESDPFKGAEDESVFDGCDSLHYICASRDYLDTSFCGRDDVCKTDSCADLHLDGDHCYEETCWLGEVVTQKRKNATEYEERLHACVDFLCDNDVGPVTKSTCSGTEQQRYMCANDGCLPFGEETRVEIVVEAGVFAGDVNMSSLHLQVETLTGVEGIEIGLELSDDAYVLQVIVLVDDEEAATNVAEAVNNLDKGESCQYGVICRAKRIHLVTSPSSTSIESMGESMPLVISGGDKSLLSITAAVVFWLALWI